MASPWPELGALNATSASFRLALPKDADRRENVDPSLWKFAALNSLDLCGVGLRRLDEVPVQAEALEAKEDVGEDDDAEELAKSVPAASGGGPVGLRRLTKLRDLILTDNALGPTLQPEGTLHGLDALRSLDLQGNALTVLPAALVSLTALTSLNVGRNRLTELPWLSLGLLPDLRLLAAPHNQLTCAVDGAGGEVTLPPRLTEVTLRGNQITDDGGLAAFGQLVALASLDVADNKLTSLPQEIAMTCSKLSRLVVSNNPWADKKLAQLAEKQQDQAPAKAILELLRKGQSRRQLKAEQSSIVKPRLRAPRLYCPFSEAVEEQEAIPEPVTQASGSKKGKKGKSNGTVASAAAASPASSQHKNKFVTVSRDALGVRPHVVMAILHVVVDEEKAHGGDSKQPYFFYAEGCTDMSPRSFDNSLEATLGLMEQNLDVQTPSADEATHGATTATARLRAFVSAQTRIHAARDLGNQRRAGALGTHNAAVLSWPLHYEAKPHSEVKFSPLSIGWMESKGVVTAADFANEAARGKIGGASKEVALALQKPAIALLATPLCPHVVDEKGVILSVHPLSNGWQTRTIADARGSILLECSSAESEATCRKMLLALIRDSIELIEGSSGGSSGDNSKDAAARSRRHVHVLVEPVDVVCKWDHKMRRTEFPTYEELMTLPSLPEGCAAGAGTKQASGGSGAGKSRKDSGGSGSSSSGSDSSDGSDSDSSDDKEDKSKVEPKGGYPQAKQQGRGRGGRGKKK